MKIMTILGSPKKNGNTAGALAMFEKLAGEKHEIDRVNISDVNVLGCQGCYSCQQDPDRPSCVLSDDANGIFERLLKADAVVYAAPLYMWGFPTGIRALMERHLSLVTGYMTSDYKSLLKGKRAAMLMTSAGPVENNAELAQGIFDRFCAYGSYDQVGKYMVPLCTTPDEIEGKADDVVKKMASELAG